jgi:flagellar FliJ protein
MASHSTLEFLIDLAATESDAAAASLGKTTRLGDEGAQKLHMLQKYRDDYVANFQAGMAAGLTASAYRNYQSFLGKLEQAIAGQQGIVASLNRKIAAQRSLWQDSERKRNSYRTLVERGVQKATGEALHREQKSMDEHAARQLFYRR